MEQQAKKISQVTARLQEYRSALITNAVTGKIDVRGFVIPACEGWITAGSNEMATAGRSAVHGA